MWRKRAVLKLSEFGQSFAASSESISPSQLKKFVAHPESTSRSFSQRPPPLSRPVETSWRDAQGYQHFTRSSNTHQHHPNPLRRWKFLGGLLLTSSCFVYVTHLETIPYTSRSHFVLISPQTEQQLGQALFEQTKREAVSRSALLDPMHPASRMVRKLGARIAAAASLPPPGQANTSHMKNLSWEFIVIDSPMANAFVAPGGKVCVFTGLIQLCSSEDELAAVLGHEVAHVLARHAAEKLSWVSVLRVAEIVFWATTGWGTSGVDALAAILLALPHSRRTETEADVIGLQLTARACYDPAAMETVFRKLGKAEKAMLGGGQVPGFLRTHPPSEERNVVIKNHLPDAYRALEAAGCGDKEQQVMGGVWGRRGGGGMGGGGGWGGREQGGEGVEWT